MSVAEFENFDEYVFAASRDDLQERIVRIQNVINALEESSVKAASRAHIESYTLDDGQTKVSTVYRDPARIVEMIRAYQRLQNQYRNELNGHVVNLRSAKSMRYYNRRGIVT